MTIFNQEMRTFIKENYKTLTDKEMSQAFLVTFECTRTPRQIKGFRDKHELFRFSNLARAERVQLKRATDQRLTVNGAVTIHKLM